MDLIDVDALIGKRVWIETESVGNDEGTAYVGTLTKLKNRTLVLKHWIRVEEWDMSHICSWTPGREVRDSLNGELTLYTSGLLRELRTIELNLKRGDPHVSIAG